MLPTSSPGPIGFINLIGNRNRIGIRLQSSVYHTVPGSFFIPIICHIMPPGLRPRSGFHFRHGQCILVIKNSRHVIFSLLEWSVFPQKRNFYIPEHPELRIASHRSRSVFPAPASSFLSIQYRLLHLILS